MKPEAENLNSLGCELLDEGKLEEAEMCFVRAAEKAPDWAVPCFNLGLLRKQQRRWPESLEASVRAARLDSSDTDHWWNVGIAATAVGDWQLARHAWRSFGLTIPEGDGPIQMDLGLTPIRLDPDGLGEVVWCQRIDPARAIIRNVPLPDSGFREGDLLLHDGAPAGTRMLNGEEVYVFDALQLLESSPRRTFSARLTVPTPDHLFALHEEAKRSKMVAEDWTGEVQYICDACSKGRPHEHHTYEPIEWDPERHVGVSALSLDLASDMLAKWMRQSPERRVMELELAVTTER